ncbi:unnamed protein product, partial [marine sediment metagenome]
GWLKELNIQTVFDIGANTGQFASMIHNVLPEALIYSFEPLEDCYRQLCTNMRGASKFKAFNFALGDRDKETEIYHDTYSPSSSLLQISKLHKKVFPFTGQRTIENVKVKRLDQVIDDLNLELKKNILLKIDVQGYEDKVILGAQKSILEAKAVLAETSYHALYEGQPLFDTIYDMLRQRGFEYMGNLEQIKNPLNGTVLQSDSIFINSA